MAKFWELFAESVILQALLALMFGGTVCYLFVVGRDVPESLTLILGAIIGFYFRSKASVEVKKGLGYTPPTPEHTEEVGTEAHE